MVRKLVAASLLAVVAVAWGCASGKSYVTPAFYQSGVRRVAVVDVGGAVKNQQAGEQVAALLEMELAKKGYTVVDRTHVQKVLAEQKFQASDVTTAEEAAQAGKILNVDAVIVVNVPALGEKITLSAKMIDVENASILWIGQGSGTTGRTVATVGGAVGGAALGSTIGKGSGRVVAGALGAAAGGVAGYAFSPQEFTQVEKIIARMCADLPSPPR